MYMCTTLFPLSMENVMNSHVCKENLNLKSFQLSFTAVWACQFLRNIEMQMYGTFWLWNHSTSKGNFLATG